MQPAFAPALVASTPRTLTRASAAAPQTQQTQAAVALGVPARAEERAAAVAADAAAKRAAWAALLESMRDPALEPGPALARAVSARDRFAAYAAYVADTVPAAEIAVPLPAPPARGPRLPKINFSWLTAPAAEPRQSSPPKPRARSPSKPAAKSAPAPKPAPVLAPAPTRQALAPTVRGAAASVVLAPVASLTWETQAVRRDRTHSVPWEGPDAGNTAAMAWDRHDEAFRMILLGAIVACSTVAWGMHFL